MPVASITSIASTCAPSFADGIDLLARYNNYFRTQPADTPERLREALALRYQVYCLERKFENASEHEDRLESDEFDDQAVHALIIHRPTSEAIGTTRLILPSHTRELPIHRLLRENGLRAQDHFPMGRSAEVSRFAISNQFRRRVGDNGFATGDIPPDRERRSNLPRLGLIQELVRQSRAHGITHWAAVMDPKLLRMLATMGIHFDPAGPLISHHGVRQPSYCCVAEMLEKLRRERPDYWVVVTDAGRLADAPRRRAA